ncbi:MAG: hypothetical protein ACREYF_07025 [Gammaproteobacteria bacterium]
MIDRKTHTPETVAAELKASPRKTQLVDRAANVNYDVSLVSSSGFYQLDWNADVIQKWDWIGLYPNSQVPDSAYITGNNWQWAVNGSPYTTQTAISSGHQARYLVWDYANSVYVAVAVSNIL